MDALEMVREIVAAWRRGECGQEVAMERIAALVGLSAGDVSVAE
jgi:hypothetical protein